ncbi:hypothetical protein LL06_12910 [Hoeflea sp. BAL378]|uniref:PopZ family protein n=1 Tax=Hoeflea sp. BAL378 TaxID=1547437 RepID=UPI000513B982|nr:PopZ family protein [Hoeflea sp. BAL378]KGF69107.1 hypothetical protein LL06_12910 [Hoeflea sp. BAL378]
MGQAGAQREPSMEEILASIRRIIENNEPAADGSHPAAGAHAFDGSDAYADELDADEADDQHARDDEPAVRPVSLAEVAALARSVPKHLDLKTELPRFAAQNFSPRTTEGETAEAQASGDQESEPRTAPVTMQVVAEIDDAAAEELRDALVSDEPVKAPDRTEAAASDSGQTDPVAQEPAQPQSEDRRGSTGQLVSLQTGEKVAAAFGELDAAIAAGQHRSFDEIAEEMLRPMLTQWLDDNLPTLVERLVREEIERVSRGNRR